LQNLLRAAGCEEEVEHIIDEMIARLPDDVRFPISKASFYLYDKKHPGKALEAINFASVRAYRTEVFRRESLA
jgi:hypothetical protein